MLASLRNLRTCLRHLNSVFYFLYMYRLEEKRLPTSIHCFHGVFVSDDHLAFSLCPLASQQQSETKGEKNKNKKSSPEIEKYKKKSSKTPPYSFRNLQKTTSVRGKKKIYMQAAKWSTKSHLF